MLESDMTFELKEHEADMGIVGIGSTIEEAFQEGARAMFSIMIELDKVEPVQSVDIKCEADSIENLFFSFLDKLLGKINLEEMVFSKFEVKITKSGAPGRRGAGEPTGIYSLTGKAYGEKLDQEKHGTMTEVKAPTYQGLKYEVKKGKHYVQCVVDV